MEFVVVLFTIMFGSIMFGAIHSDYYCRGDVVDIYYPIDQENLAYHSDCVYTKTPRSCIACGIIAIRRSKYDDFAKGYTKYGLKPPVPRRTDTNALYAPYDGFTPQNKLKRVVDDVKEKI